MELIDGRPVLYSLGDLIFDLTRSEETVEGLIAEITFVGLVRPRSAFTRLSRSTSSSPTCSTRPVMVES